MIGAATTKPSPHRRGEGKRPPKERGDKDSPSWRRQQICAPFSALHFPEKSIPVEAEEKALPMHYRTLDYIRKIHE